MNIDCHQPISPMQIYRPIAVIASLLLCFLLFTSSIIQSQVFNEAAKIEAADAYVEDWFGHAVAISGNYAIIGAFQEDEDASGGNTMNKTGSAYIWERSSGNGNWMQVQKLVASDRNFSDYFGYSVSISGNYAVVGAYQEDENAVGGDDLFDAGSVYIFEREPNGYWKEVQKIVASDRAISDHFGWAVSISGNYLVASAHGEDEDAAGANTLNYAGSAYVFEKDGTGNWLEVEKIVPSDREANDWFGYTLGMSGDYIIVGAYKEDHDASGGNTMDESGAAYIFERDVNGNWSEVEKLVASDRAESDYFGYSLSVDGDYAVIGAYNDFEDANGGNFMPSAGSAYFFERDVNGNWLEVQKIAASDRDIGDNFGWSVGISGDYALITAHTEDEDDLGANTMPGAGSVYLFEREANGTWNEMQKMVASDRYNNDRFGMSVAISNEYFIVGAHLRDAGTDILSNEGAAYIFESVNSGVKENANVVDMSLFPNPTSGDITLALGEKLEGNVEMKIFNNLGQLVKFNRRIPVHAVIKLNELPSGIYTVHLIHHELVASERLVIE